MNDLIVSERKPDLGDRFVSMVIDQLVMTVIAVLLAAPNFIYISSYILSDTAEAPVSEFNLFTSPFWYLTLLGIVLYYCKDSIKGRSLAKRLLRLQVVNHKTSEAASPLRCMLRNLTAFIWPVEFIFVLASPSRRLGDLLAGTRVVVYDDKVVQQPVSTGKVLAALGVAYVLIFAATLPLWNLQHKMRRSEPHYVKTSYDPKASAALSHMMEDSLNGYFETKIRVYDKTENDTVKYISCVFKAKDMYYYNEFSQDTVHRRVLGLLYSQYPRKSFVGTAKFIQAESNGGEGVTTHIGRRRPHNGDAEPEIDEQMP